MAQRASAAAWDVTEIFRKIATDGIHLKTVPPGAAKPDLQPQNSDMIWNAAILGRNSFAIPGARVHNQRMNPLLQRIRIDPGVCFGKPCIKGTRIWVSLLLDFLANGMSEAEILADYPYLTRDDLRAAMAYGAEAARERIIPVPMAA